MKMILNEDSDVKITYEFKLKKDFGDGPRKVKAGYRIIADTANYLKLKKQKAIQCGLKATMVPIDLFSITRFLTTTKATVVKENEMGTIQMAPLVSEKHMGFSKLVAALKKKGVKECDIPEEITMNEDAAALAAWIGRKKYGKKKFQAMAAAGRRKAAKK